MPGATIAAEIDLLIYPMAQLSAVHGLTDLFLVANRLAHARLGAGAPRLRIRHLSQDDVSDAVVSVFDTDPDQAAVADVIILPPSLADPQSRSTLAPLADWLRERHARGAVLASVCAGAFLLAETGLLTGRSVTTHWIHAHELAARFPDVTVDINQLLVDDGDVVTAGGLMAWTDLGLRLVDRLLGPVSMVETARFLLVDPPGREQRYYSAFSPNLAHGDTAVLKAQHWLQTDAAVSATVAAIAAYVGMEERTFQRRFRRATGLRPREYCQQLRVGKARALLESSREPVEQIAWRVGYEDPASFRRAFARYTGLSPRDYRRRFGASRRREPVF